jgi:hypothetical protein
MRLTIPIFGRLLLLVAAVTCLVFGAGTGLFRLGWNVRFPATEVMVFHGVFMVCGFLGTVISLERAIAIGRRWAYLGPIFAAAGVLALVFGVNWIVGAGLITLASVVLVLASMNVFLRQCVFFTATLLLGSVCWLVGNLLWLGDLAMTRVAPWWIGFLVLTIAGERLELSRLMRLSKFASISFVIIVAMFLLGASMVSVIHPFGLTLFSGVMMGLALWLLRYDIVRKTVRQQGLTRYIAICLISGYAWMLIAAVIGLSSIQLTAGSTYDAWLHAIFVGFVFSMIFGHAPIILPAIAKIRILYHPIFYLPLLVLHCSLVIRVAGDLLMNQPQRSVGGALNALALALFFMTVVAAVIRSKQARANA